VPQARTTSPQPVRHAAALALALALAACLSEPEPSGVNTAPAATITAPAVSITFKGGDSIAYAGKATDAEDGAEPGSSLTWWVVLHHDTHTHPFMPRTTGSSGKVLVPPIGETSDNVFLRLYLEAIDDSGSADTVTRDILPQKSQFTLATEPVGLSVTLDGQPAVAPETITGVVGMDRELGVETTQSLGATQYRFSSWSDGGAATHRIATPATATTYTARFTPVVNQLPTVAITAPSGGASVTVNITTTISATAADGDGTVSKVGFYDGTTLISEDQASPYTAGWTPTTTGPHARTARATDNQGGVTTSATVNVTVNASTNQPPTATLTAPSAGATLAYNTPVTLSATAADGDGTVSKVGFYDGTTLLGEDATSPYSYSWTPTTAGSHSLTARATDSQDAVGSSAAVSVTVSPPPNQPPTVSITAPANGAVVVVNTTVTFSANTADPGGSVQRVRFYDGATQLFDDTSAPYATDWVPTTLGRHTLTAVAVDNANASTTSAAVTVTVAGSGSDTQAPTLRLTSPAGQTQDITGSPTFTVSAADNIAVTAVDYQVDGETVGQATSPPWSFTLPTTTAYTSGVHVIRARARDAAGNPSGWSSARVTFGGGTSMPAGFSRSIYANKLAWQGTAMAWSPDGRLFICEQGGSVRVVKNGVMLGTPFVTVPTTAEGERGLLGIAFHPQFASNGWVYLYYTSATGGAHNRISRFTASGDVARAGSETVLVELPGLSAATNHNGGALHFGPDGKLYAAVGENATPSNAPLLTTVMGKLLRFNDDGSIPADNPFYGSTAGLNRSIWARGLRNPFTFAFEPGTGLMYINDVGQASWEEINVGRAGADYGWPGTEGATSASGIDSPLFTYRHSANSTLVTGQAIVGGTFYRPSTVMFPSAWVGDYFFGDYVAGWINRLDTSNGNGVYAFARLGNLTDIQVGPDGALYVLALVDGTHWGVFRYSR
jgi:glucose/arabinose dehydrogenase